MDLNETAKILSLIQTAYPNYKPGNAEATIKLWSAVLRDCSFKDIQNALVMYIRDDTKGFAPAIGQLIARTKKVQERQNPNAEEAWTITYRAICNGNYNSASEFEKLPDAVKRTIGSARYLEDMAKTPTDQIHSVEKSHFIRAYNTELERERQMLTIPDNIKQDYGIGVREYQAIEQREEPTAEDIDTTIADTTWKALDSLKAELGYKPEQPNNSKWTVNEDLKKLGEGNV